MVLASDFQYFDPDAEVSYTKGNLPHWEQPGATYFITYRTVDSIANESMVLMLRLRKDFIQRFGMNVFEPGATTNSHGDIDGVRRTFARKFATLAEKSLDELRGSCVLRDTNVRQIVEKSLLHFNDVRHLTAAFVIMPNHVHILARIFPQFRMLEQCYGWKHFQASRINKLKRGKGHVFAPESFDHLVRDPEHLQKFVEYIKRNPEKAGLKPDEYTLYLPEIDFSR